MPLSGDLQGKRRKQVSQDTMKKKKKSVYAYSTEKNEK